MPSSPDQKPSLTLPLTLLALSILLSTIIASATLYQAKVRTSDMISTTGSAERTIVSDQTKWTSSFSRNVDAQGLKAGSEQMKNDLQSVMSFFKAKGIKESEVTVQPLTVSQVCENQSSVMYDPKGGQICGKVIGYSLQQSLTVESSDVATVRTLAQDAPSVLLGQGVVFTSQNIEYYYSKLADLKLDMLAEASKNAKDRAEKIISSTGGSIGKIQTAAMGVFQITAVNSADVSDYGAYDTAALNKKVTAVVRASFTLK